jgi:putative endonuclease
MAAGWVYFMANRPNGILYVGVTDNLPRRAWEHRDGLVDGFNETVRVEAARLFRTP